MDVSQKKKKKKKKKNNYDDDDDNKMKAKFEGDKFEGDLIMMTMDNGAR